MPTWRDLRNFCKGDGWELYKTTHHEYYRKEDGNNNIRRVKVSRGTGEISKHLWKEILKKQLRVDEEYFNKKK